MRLRVLVLAVGILVALAGEARAGNTVRIAVLKFGTVSWLVDVIRHHGLDAKHGVELAVTPLAGTQATKVALQAGSADIIVSDWLWVSRQRHAGADYALSPYSAALGAVMVSAASPIRTLADMKGRTGRTTMVGRRRTRPSTNPLRE